MNELSLESLALRVQKLEARFEVLANVIPPSRDWRTVVGISTRTEFSDTLESEMEALRNADREAAAAGEES